VAVLGGALLMGNGQRVGDRHLRREMGPLPLLTHIAPQGALWILGEVTQWTLPTRHRLVAQRRHRHRARVVALVRGRIVLLLADRALF